MRPGAAWWRILKGRRAPCAASRASVGCGSAALVAIVARDMPFVRRNSSARLPIVLRPRRSMCRAARGAGIEPLCCLAP